jgi:peptidoglycan/xylan/chitin deacetylase (PgdA/CDA1 family)
MAVATTIKHLLQSVGYYRDRLRARSYDGVAVLAYHGVRDDAQHGAMQFENLHVRTSTFDAHCRCLRELECTPLSLADWHAIARGDEPVPPRAVLLTFDDGYRSVLANALPVLERYEMAAAVFVCSRPVERQVRFWFDAVAKREGEEMVARAKELDYASWQQVVERFEMPVDSDDPHAPLTIAELQQLAAHPLVTVGAHSMSHPILSRAPIEVQREEIRGSRVALEGWIDRPVTAFAYPNGRPGLDFTVETEGVVAASGMRVAFSTGQQMAHPVVRSFNQPRFIMLDAITAVELAHRLAVSWPRALAAC